LIGGGDGFLMDHWIFRHEGHGIYPMRNVVLHY
jgi:hypothetical protein